jgi:hypothetical protein
MARSRARRVVRSGTFQQRSNKPPCAFCQRGAVHWSRAPGPHTPPHAHTLQGSTYQQAVLVDIPRNGLNDPGRRVRHQHRRQGGPVGASFAEHKGPRWGRHCERGVSQRRQPRERYSAVNLCATANNTNGVVTRSRRGSHALPTARLAHTRHVSTASQHRRAGARLYLATCTITVGVELK